MKQPFCKGFDASTICPVGGNGHGQATKPSRSPPHHASPERTEGRVNHGALWGQRAWASNEAVTLATQPYIRDTTPHHNHGSKFHAWFLLDDLGRKGARPGGGKGRGIPPPEETCPTSAHTRRPHHTLGRPAHGEEGRFPTNGTPDRALVVGWRLGIYTNPPGFSFPRRVCSASALPPGRHPPTGGGASGSALSSDPTNREPKQKQQVAGVHGELTPLSRGTNPPFMGN